MSDDGNGHRRHDQLGVRYVARDHEPSERGRDDAGLARPREEGHLLAGPAPTAVRPETEEHGEGSREDDEGEHDHERPPEVVPDLLPRQIRAERDEDEDHDDLRDRGDEGAHVPFVVRVHPEAEAIHVPDDETGEERAEVAAPTREVGREVADRDDSDDSDRSRLLPDAGTPVRHHERQQDPEPDPEHRRDAEILQEVDDRPGHRGIAALDDADEHEREDGPGGVVQSRLRDGRLLDLLANPDAVEERDQDRRIGGRDDGPEEQPRRERDVERDRRDRTGHERGDHDPGHREQADPDGDAAEHADRELQPAVEEDERHTERQEELGARRVERDVDGAGDRRPEQRPAEEEDEHARRADRVRDELAHETRDEHDPEREDDVLRRHRRDSLPCGGRTRPTVGDTPTAAPYDAPVLLFLLLGFTPWILLLTLVVALYLTVIELRELELHYTWWIWWLLLVFMTHFVGYLFLRAYALYRKRQLAQP